MKHLARLLVFTFVCVLASRARAQDRFVVAAFDALSFEGERPQAPDPQALLARFGWRPALGVDPYVVLDGPGEAYLEHEQVNFWQPRAGAPLRLVARVPAAPSPAELRGRVFALKADLSGFEAYRFKLASGSDDPTARDAFYSVMEAHYRDLARRGLPGAAWFRHQERFAQAQHGTTPGAETNLEFVDTPADGRTLDDTFDLFTGERALAENLDLERGLRVGKDEERTIDVATIEGVTTRAMDWKTLVKDLHPELDVLAQSIPADQHGVFFPSFDAMVRVFDEIDQSGTPVLHFASARAENQRTKERYQQQLCMPLSTLARTLGPTIVASVALTGSDPFLPSGSDLAVLFECKQPAVLASYLGLRHVEAKGQGAKLVEGTLGTIKYAGSRSDDRRISSYVAQIESTIVVTNSLEQLKRIVAARAGSVPRLASTDEYVWFRERYKKSDASESALVVLSDATIRRWASANERIGNSRRVRAAAAMAEIQAAHLDELVQGKLAPGSSAANSALPFSADFVWTKSGIVSPTWGNFAFMTPLSELAIERVTPGEKQGYENFRRAFQNLWANVFDPIALRLSFTEGKLAADMTVMPLAVTTEYRQFMELTRGAALAATSGDGHADTLFHFALAFGPKNELGRMFTSGLGPFAQQLGADPLGWIGGGIALYADRDPFWDELAKAKDRSDFMSDNFYRLPLALHVEVKDALKLAGFLAAVRAMADGAAPGLTNWETKTWNEQGYVKIVVEENVNEAGDKAAVYYAAMPDGFVLSLREDLVQRAMDRRKARKAGQADPARDKAWLGSSLGLRVERDAVDLVSGLATETLGDQLQQAAWSALPILNEWKRRYPAEEPVALHERLWGVHLETPAGGSFVWNDALQSMEASDYGSPAAPKQGPALPQALEHFTRGAFGLSFEGEGLRVRAELEREPH